MGNLFQSGPNLMSFVFNRGVGCKITHFSRDPSVKSWRKPCCRAYTCMSQGSTNTDTRYRHRQSQRHSHRYSHNWFYSFCQKHLTLFSKYQLNVLRFVSLSYYLQLGDRNSAPIPDHCTATAGVGGRSIFLRF